MAEPRRTGIREVKGAFANVLAEVGIVAALFGAALFVSWIVLLVT